MERPADFECPWCGPNGVPIDKTLPASLQLCDACNLGLIEPTAPSPPDPGKKLHISQLRSILKQHVAELHTPRWPGCEFGKVSIGNAILGALEVLGCARKVELEQATAGAGLSGYDRQKHAEAVLAARKESVR